MCGRCGLRLTGPEAARLWQVDQALAGLEAHRGELLAERTALLAVLRPGPVLAPTHSLAPTPAAPGPATASSRPAAGMPAPVWGPPAGASPNWQSPVPQPRQEWTPQRVQNTLLGLGALLLTVAAIVFTAVTYDRLGAGG
ncbi:MAG: hypothetical protein QOD70_3388, partial [Frankiales bacterium]|nr:hypothetical protein [Frankiales bacterium]